MTSANNQHVVSEISPERQNSIGDDPWCLTCGVNLALDGGTYTSVTRHNNSELCGIFSRVLGAEFSEDYASVNVCNRCERQLRRLGRYNSIVLARREGEKLREQLEKNLAKHGQVVIESGQAEDEPVATSDVEVIAKGEPFISSNTGEKLQGHERHSSIRRPGKHKSRSVSSVHFEDKEEVLRKALVRKHSAPEGFRRRESLSPFSEAERRREARRRKWSSTSSTSEENAISSLAIPPDRKHSLGNRAFLPTSHQQRYAEMSDEAAIPADQLELSGEVALTSSNILEEPTDGSLEVSPSDIHTSGEVALTSSNILEEPTDGSLEVPPSDIHTSGEVALTSSNILEEPTDGSLEVSPSDIHTSGEVALTSSNILEEPTDGSLELSPSDIHVEQEHIPSCEEQEAPLDKSVDQQECLQRMDTLQADDELFRNLEEELTKESPQDSESSNEADLDPSDFNADNRSNMSEVEERITTKTKFKGAYYNIGSTEDLLAEFANETDRERAMWSKLTYTESIDIGDGGVEPVRPPRRKSVRSLQKKRDGQTQEGAKGNEANGDKPEQIKEECESQDAAEADKQGNDVKANGVLPDKQNSSEEKKTVVAFDTECPEGTDSQTAQDGTTSKTKTEKSPLIGKDAGSSNLNLRNGSRMKKQLQGMLCCTIL